MRVGKFDQGDDWTGEEKKKRKRKNLEMDEQKGEEVGLYISHTGFTNLCRRIPVSPPSRPIESVSCPIGSLFPIGASPPSAKTIDSGEGGDPPRISKF